MKSIYVTILYSLAVAASACGSTIISNASSGGVGGAGSTASSGESDSGNGGAGSGTGGSGGVTTANSSSNGGNGDSTSTTSTSSGNDGGVPCEGLTTFDEIAAACQFCGVEIVCEAPGGPLHLLCAQIDQAPVYLNMNPTAICWVGIV